jgi:glycosyltransferase involved in cell wall biosynthesis
VTSVEVVVPVYNEETDVGRNIPVLRDFLSGDTFPYEWKIIIGDNGSTDRTPEVSQDLARQYPDDVAYYRATAKGKGRVIKECWLAGEADVLSFMDIDLSTGLDAFPPLISAIADEGFDVAIGSRLHSRSIVTRSLKRRILTRGYNILVRSLFQTSFNDAQCGFKAASREAVQRVVPLVEDLNWFFDTEFLVLAEKMGYRVREIPVKWEEDERTSVKMVSTIASDLRGLARLRLSRPWREGA